MPCRCGPGRPRQTGTAWLEAGTVWSRALHEAAPFGLAPLAGSAPQVGAGAYTLGGGARGARPALGFSADHVRRLDVVTADGGPGGDRRGAPGPVLGGAREGAATSASSPGCRSSWWTSPRFTAADCSTRARTPGSPRNLARHRSQRTRRDQPVRSTPGLPGPPRRAGTPAGSLVLPRPDQLRRAARRRCEEVIAPLRRSGDPAAGHRAHHAGDRHRHDPQRPRHPASDQQPLPGAAPGRLRTPSRRSCVTRGPTPPIGIEVRQLGGAFGPGNPPCRQCSSGTATGRSPSTPRPIRTPPAWVASDGAAEQALLDDLAPWSDGGALVNFLAGPHVSPGDVRAAYEPDLWARLVEIKTRGTPTTSSGSTTTSRPRPPQR